WITSRRLIPMRWTCSGTLVFIISPFPGTERREDEGVPRRSQRRLHRRSHRFLHHTRAGACLNRRPCLGLSVPSAAEKQATIENAKDPGFRRCKGEPGLRVAVGRDLPP